MMKKNRKLSFIATSIRNLNDVEVTQVVGGYTSIAACGDDPTNRPCITVHALTGCPTGVPVTPSTPAATCPSPSSPAATCPSPSSPAATCPASGRPRCYEP
ncbi:MAG: hypothetical protein K2P84_13995 [Undibacterium sp.]|nr:hypothetical protein [Undibacterium sp.]